MADQKSVAVDSSEAVEVLASRESDDARVLNLGGNTAWLGNEDVTDADGYPLDPGDSIRVQPEGPESLHAICSDGEACDLRVLS
jgi:hypothetical protein